ncbi:Response regulator containing a CheY-like receiver domain and an HTH DNA-binding domain protein [Sinomonas atrocyanea]|uniref:Response regulator containing a CheY-like receiver domain and an HTH DNA-binding domain protein n=1 Tax=Sinomonas atrocyanea TaxID=37927 RepID=A0A126ZY96_9MICC|nr:Response regulator containing a CheY-like receiver domain and an HTH DNA-binding domain protein [Sinomonas atrocyanea]
MVGNELARQEIRRLLKHEGIQVVGESGSARQALGRIRALGPDVAVLDSQLVDGKGIQVCLQARETVPRLGCVVLVSYHPESTGPTTVDRCEFVLRDIRAHGLPAAGRRAAANSPRPQGNGGAG